MSFANPFDPGLALPLEHFLECRFLQIGKCMSAMDAKTGEVE